MSGARADTPFRDGMAGQLPRTEEIEKKVQRVVRTIAEDFKSDPRFQESAILAILEAAAADLIGLFEQAEKRKAAEGELLSDEEIVQILCAETDKVITARAKQAGALRASSAFLISCFVMGLAFLWMTRSDLPYLRCFFLLSGERVVSCLAS